MFEILGEIDPSMKGCIILHTKQSEEETETK